MHFAKTKLNYLQMLLWMSGLGLYVGARVIFVNFFKTFIFLGVFASMNLINAAFAYEAKPLPLVIDEAHELHFANSKQISTVLKLAAEKESTKVRVVIIQEQESIQVSANKWISAFEKEYPKEIKETSFIFINSLTQESCIVLAQGIEITDSLQVSLVNIQQKIILPELAVNKLNKATWEGAIALITALEYWPTPPSSFEIMVYKLIRPLKLLAGFLTFLGLSLIIKRVLRPLPHWETIDFTQSFSPETPLFVMN